jgi:hypothetical protein
MWKWLNDNAGAVQAVTALAIMVLTAVLGGVTYWYAKLTQRMALTLEQQLVASFYPDVELVLKDKMQGSGVAFGEEHASVSGTIVVKNKGNVPIKVISVAMKVVYDAAAFPPQTLTVDAKHRVVSSSQTTEFLLLTLEVPVGGSRGSNYEQIAQIHCSDLAGVSKHTFSVSNRHGEIIQSVGFQPI